MISTSTWSEAIGGLYGRVQLGVQLLPGLEHRDELLQAARAGLGALGVMQPVEDRVAVLAVERVEERARGGARVELALKIVGDGHRRLARVRLVPAPVALRGLDRRVPGRPHAPLGDQPLGL